MERLYVTREAIEAYERRTGFVGIGKYFEERGLMVFPKEGRTCKPVQ